MSVANPERATPFLVLGDTRRRVLAESVRARVERWSAHWAPEQKCSVRVDVPESGEREARLHDLACFRITGPHPPLVIAAPARCMPLIVGLLGDCGEGAHVASSQQGLAGELELQAITALAREFRTPDVLEPAVERVAIPAVDLQREYTTLRYATAFVTLGEARQPLLFLISPELVSALLPMRSSVAGGERLDRRSAAIGQEVVAVEVLLGEGEVSLGDLTRLAVGDVIVLDRKLADPVSLTIPGHGSIVHAAPGRVDSMRAVQIRRGATL